jgi:peroxiredoxin
LLKLERAYRERGLKVVLVSWDETADDARKFLAQQGVEFPSYIKSPAERDETFLEAFGSKWTGALPATFLFDGAGKLVDSWEGMASYETFQQKVESAMGGKT